MYKYLLTYCIQVPAYIYYSELKLIKFSGQIVGVELLGLFPAFNIRLSSWLGLWL